MNTRRKLILAASGAILLATTGVAAVAGERGCREDGGKGWSEMRGMIQGRVEQRLERLGSGLALRADQQAAWQQFRGSLLAQAGEMQQKMQAMRAAAEGSTAIGRLEMWQQGADERQAGLARLIAATRSFYGELDERQKAYFDEHFRLPGGPGGPGGRHGPRHGA